MSISFDPKNKKVSFDSIITGDHSREWGVKKVPLVRRLVSVSVDEIALDTSYFGMPAPTTKYTEDFGTDNVRDYKSIPMNGSIDIKDASWELASLSYWISDIVELCGGNPKVLDNIFTKGYMDFSRKDFGDFGTDNHWKVGYSILQPVPETKLHIPHEKMGSFGFIGQIVNFINPLQWAGIDFGYIEDKNERKNPSSYDPRMSSSTIDWTFWLRPGELAKELNILALGIDFANTTGKMEPFNDFGYVNFSDQRWTYKLMTSKLKWANLGAFDFKTDFGVDGYVGRYIKDKYPGMDGMEYDIYNYPRFLDTIGIKNNSMDTTDRLTFYYKGFTGKIGVDIFSPLSFVPPALWDGRVKLGLEFGFKQFEDFEQRWTYSTYVDFDKLVAFKYSWGENANSKLAPYKGEEPVPYVKGEFQIKQNIFGWIPATKKFNSAVIPQLNLGWESYGLEKDKKTNFTFNFVIRVKAWDIDRDTMDIKQTLFANDKSLCDEQFKTPLETYAGVNAYRLYEYGKAAAQSGTLSAYEQGGGIAPREIK